MEEKRYIPRVPFLVGERMLEGLKRFGGIEGHRPFLLLCRLVSNQQGQGQYTTGPGHQLQCSFTRVLSLSLLRERNLARYRSLARLTLNQVSPAKLSSFPHIHFLNSAPKALFSSSLTAIQSKFRVLRYSVRSDLSSVSNLCLNRAVSERMNRDRRSGLGVSLSVDHYISKSRVC